MKTLEQLAKRKAYKLFFSTSNIILSNNIRIKRNFDMRTNLDQKAIVIFMQLVNTIDKKKILKVKTERASRKSIESNNILQNKLLLDFQRNKDLRIYQDRLSDGCRNHWAKNEQDFRVLKVLRKYYPNLTKQSN